MTFTLVTRSQNPMGTTSIYTPEMRNRSLRMMDLMSMQGMRSRTLRTTGLIFMREMRSSIGMGIRLGMGPCIPGRGV